MWIAAPHSRITRLHFKDLGPVDFTKGKAQVSAEVGAELLKRVPDLKEIKHDTKPKRKERD